jgi:hypothetical protein
MIGLLLKITPLAGVYLLIKTRPDIVVNASYEIALVGGGICVLLHIAGWRDGLRAVGVLMVGHVVVRILCS